MTIDLQASGDRDINLASVSGDLTVRLPETSDLQVKLQSTSGQVSSAFEQLERDRTQGRYSACGRLRLYLLKLLDESPRHGYDIIRLLEDRFLGL